MPDTPKTAPDTPEAEPEQKSTPAPKEIGGRDGPDPVRYGDWEKGGIAVDF